MKDKKMLTIAMSAAVLAVAGGLVIYAQDKYTVKVPGGLAFSEFQGIRNMAGHLHQSERESSRSHPRQSRE